MIYFYNYNDYFRDFLVMEGIVFENQQEADEYYSIWIKGFIYSSDIYY